MKQSIFFSILCLIFSFNLTAQSPNIARATKAADRMAKRLSLDADQKLQVRDAYLEMYNNMSNIPSDANYSAEEEKIQAEFERKINNILTTEQKDKKDKGINERRERIDRTRDTAQQMTSEQRQEKIRNMATKKTDRINKELGLTDEQYRTILEASITKITKTQELRNLSKTDRSKSTELRKQINADYDATLNQVLTTEQKEKQQKLKMERVQKRQEMKKARHGDRKMKYPSANLDKKADAYTSKMADELELTNDQIAPFKTAYLKKLKNKRKLSGKDPEVKKAARKKINSQFEESLAQFLSEDQMELYRKYQSEKQKMRNTRE